MIGLAFKNDFDRHLTDPHRVEPSTISKSRYLVFAVLCWAFDFVFVIVPIVLLWSWIWTSPPAPVHEYHWTSTPPPYATIPRNGKALELW